MVYSSTTVASGRGRAVVVAIGMNSEIGHLADALESSEDKQMTKIQRALYKMYGALIFIAGAGAILILGINKFDVTYAVAMHAVTAVLSVLPAGLTTVLMVTLVMGGKEMAQRNAIVRKLKCLETLGSVTHIFSDKTGTLTQAKMSVVAGWTPVSGHIRVVPPSTTDEESLGSIAFVGSSSAAEQGKPLSPEEALPEDVELVSICASLCNVAPDPSLHRAASKMTLPGSSADLLAPAVGSPTEIALQAFTEIVGLSRRSLIGSEMGNKEVDTRCWFPVVEYPFSSSLKRMSVVAERRGASSSEYWAFTKGAPEVVLSLCTPDAARDERVRSMVTELSSQALRVILFARRAVNADEAAKLANGTTSDRAGVETGLELLGLLALHDPPRPESLPSVLKARTAGISVHMLTGDHSSTAVSIAHQVGIISRDPRSLSPDELDALVTTGPEFDAKSDDEIDALAALPLVVARCSPETKVKMVRAAQRRRYIVAMTGDGVNDSPSLKIADVGIAMGMSGSDIARDVSDIVLADDNFATIIAAVAEGRRIYQNVQRFLLYYWVPLFGVAIVVVSALWVRDPSGLAIMPFTPIMLLFLYIGLTPPAGTLSTRPASKTVMLEPPRPPREGLFNREIIADIVFYSLLLAVTVLGAFAVVLYGVGDGITADDCDTAYQADGCSALFRARALSLCVLLNVSFIVSVHCRSYRDREWTTRVGLGQTMKDKVFLPSLAVLWVLLIVFMYVPAIAIGGFGMQGITWEWGLLVGITVFWIFAGDAWKVLKNTMWKMPARDAELVMMEMSSTLAELDMREMSGTLAVAI